jgi:glycosyltransferase involved in cell wall biosynthesis
MHVALYSPAWPADRHPNGIAAYVHLLRAELLRQGHRVSIFTARLLGDTREPGVYVVSPTLGFRLQRRLVSMAGGVAPGPLGWGRLIAEHIARVHAMDPIDVVEMEETFGWCADVMRRQPVPLVVKLHGPACLSLLGEDRERPEAQRRLAAEGAALRQLPVVVSPSRYTLQATIDHHGLAPAIAEVVPNPMGVRPDVPTWDASRCDTRTLLFVGRFDHLKGGDTMLLAFARLLEYDPALRLVFVGPDRGLAGPHGARTDFAGYCATHLSAAQRARIDYRGALPREEIYTLRTQAAVSVITSRYDNQPNTALEAMAQAAPVVAVDAGGVSELIRHGVTGRLARAGDLDSLCAELRATLADLPAAARMGHAAREFVQERHGLPAVATRTLALYRRAIALHRGDRAEDAALPAQEEAGS